MSCCCRFRAAKIKYFVVGLSFIKNVVLLQSDISREYGTTIRQVRTEAFRFGTTAPRFLRQNKKAPFGAFFMSVWQ